MLVYDTMSAMGKTCSFFGHRFVLDIKSVKEQLKTLLEKMITQEGVDIFYLGEQGDFEIIAAEVLSATVESLGNMLNLANYSAQIAKMMALVISAILFGIICEFIFKKISDKVGEWK